MSQRPRGRQTTLKEVYIYVFHIVITVSIKQVKQGNRKARWGAHIAFGFVLCRGTRAGLFMFE